MRTLCTCAALLGAALLAVAARGDVAKTTLTRIHAGAQPCAEIGGFGSVWVADFGGAMLTRIDPKTNRVVGHVRVGSQPCGLTTGAGSIWVDGYGTNQVERVDPERMKVVARTGTGPGVWDVAWDGRDVWADDNVDGSILRIDPRTNRVVTRLTVPVAPAGLAVADGSLWVGANGAADRAFYRVDLQTAKARRVPAGCLRPAYFAVAPGRDPWVTCVGSVLGRGTALRIDPATDRVLARVTLGHGPGDGAIDAAGRVWIPNKADGTISRIDPATNAVVETVEVGGSPFVLNEAFGDIWSPDNGGTDVVRLHAG